jgi:hypothetical protein
MTYSTTNEISPTLNHEEYHTRLALTVRKIATEMMTKSEKRTVEPEEELEVCVTEHLSAISDLYLTHPISVIEHSEASLSHRGASRLGDVSTTEGFAQEHARDLLEQKIVSALEQVLEGETVAGVRRATSDDRDGPFVVTADPDKQESGRQHVRISPQTAVRARDELRSHIEYSDSEIDTSDAEEAIKDLEQSLRGDTPRTAVVREGNMEEVVVRGVPRETIKIDYGPAPPRAVVQTPDNCVIEPVISLPSKSESDQTDTGTASSNRGDE